MTRPDLLAFDLMDTVVGDPFLPVLARLGADAVAALRESLDSSAWIDFELGRIEEPTFLKRLFRRPPPRPELSAELLRDAIVDGYGFVPGMEHLLEELRASGARLWVLSNYPQWAERVRRQLALDRFFEGYAISYRTGARKPDEAAYRQLARLSGVPLERSLLIDDRPANVEGARRAGMPGLLFVDAARLRVELSACGALV